jgi:hypothetical protein
MPDGQEKVNVCGIHLELQAIQQLNAENGDQKANAVDNGKGGAFYRWRYGLGH